MNVVLVAASILLVFTVLFFFELRVENRNGKGVIISLVAAIVSFFLILLPAVFFFLLLLVGHYFYPDAFFVGKTDDFVTVSLASSAGLYLSEITIEKLAEVRLKRKKMGLSYLYLYKMLLAWGLLLCFSNLFLGVRWDINALLVISGLFALLGYGLNRISKNDDGISPNL